MRRVDEPPSFGWFCNRVPGYPDTLFLKSLVKPRSVDERFMVELEATDHKLAIDARDGITFERAVTIAELMLHGLKG